MKKIVEGVYTETTYPGVTLGAVVLEHGIILVAAPPSTEDGQAWIRELNSISPGRDRLLVTLDTHPDRTLGARALDCNVIAHESTLGIYKQRPMIFKGQSGQSGSEWEENEGLNGIRWLAPNITFSESSQVHLGDFQVIIEHHPGSEPGASWVVLPQQQIIFVGDTVVVKQPPFLANADLDKWIETLDLLLAREYKDYQLISSRGGIASEKDVRNMRRYLADLKKKLDRLGKRKSKPEDLEKLIPRLLSACESPVKSKRQHTERLRYGLFHYYANHYYPISGSND